MSKCPKCGADVGMNQRFCPNCGSPVPQMKRCLSCGATVAADAKFCGACGGSMTGAGSSGVTGATVGGHAVVGGNVTSTVANSDSHNVTNHVTNTDSHNVTNHVTNNVSNVTTSDSHNLTQNVSNTYITVDNGSKRAEAEKRAELNNQLQMRQAELQYLERVRQDGLRREAQVRQDEKDRQNAEKRARHLKTLGGCFWAILGWAFVIGVVWAGYKGVCWGLARLKSGDDKPASRSESGSSSGSRNYSSETFSSPRRSYSESSPRESHTPPKPVTVTCRVCQGRRVVTRSETCSTCGGQGRIVNTAAQVGDAIGGLMNAFGTMGGGKRGRRPPPMPRQRSTSTVCPTCHGSRAINVQTPCTGCDGTGTTVQR